MNVRRAALAAGLLVAAGMLSPARGGEGAPPPFVHLEYRSVTTNETIGENVKRKTPLPPREEGTLRVVLGPRHVDIAEEGRRTILDYANERVVRVRPDGSRREGSLIASLAFLDMEMTNRAHIAEALGAGGMKDASTNPREVSILFGWRAKGDESAVTTRADGEATVFRDGEEELARWTPSAEALDEAQGAAFSRFLQRSCRLHPAVREAIVAQRRAPASLRFRSYNVGTKSSRELTLAGTKRTAAGEPAPAGGRTFDDADPIARVARRVLDPSKEDLALRLAKDDFVRLAGEARKAGRFEDAALLLVECGLQTGDTPTDELRELRADRAAQERVGKLLGIIGRNDPAKVVTDIAALDRTAFSRSHVLDIFRANALASTRKLDEASEAMVGVLTVSPWLTGAWKDLGDMHYARFDTERAWLAWEAGRRAAPEHPMWKPVLDFEAHLRKAYADLL